MNDELEQAFRQGYIAGRSEEDERLKKIAVHYGYTAQREQLIEECSEAILAAQKCKRTGFKLSKDFANFNNLLEYEKNFLNLSEEVADVLIMARQMRLLMGAKVIDEIIDKKLNRQLERISKGE